MTVDDVAEAAGVGKATIYRRWASKELLANDAMADLFDIEIPDADTGSIAGDLRQIYRVALTFANSEYGRAMIRLAVSRRTATSSPPRSTERSWSAGSRSPRQHLSGHGRVANRSRAPRTRC